MTERCAAVAPADQITCILDPDHPGRCVTHSGIVFDKKVVEVAGPLESTYHITLTPTYVMNLVQNLRSALSWGAGRLEVIDGEIPKHIRSALEAAANATGPLNEMQAEEGRRLGIDRKHLWRGKEHEDCLVCDRPQRHEIHRMQPWRPCTCQGSDGTYHAHYPDPPYACARCSECDAFTPMPTRPNGGFRKLHDATVAIEELGYEFPPNSAPRRLCFDAAVWAREMLEEYGGSWVGSPLHQLSPDELEAGLHMGGIGTPLKRVDEGETMPVLDVVSITPTAIARERAEGWIHFHPESFCHLCGHRNLRSWGVSNEVWNRIADSNGLIDGAGIVCPQCFAERYEAADEFVTWTLVPS